MLTSGTKASRNFNRLAVRFTNPPRADYRAATMTSGSHQASPVVIGHVCVSTLGCGLGWGAYNPAGRVKDEVRRTKSSKEATHVELAEEYLGGGLYGGPGDVGDAEVLVYHV